MRASDEELLRLTRILRRCGNSTRTGPSCQHRIRENLQAPPRFALNLTCAEKGDPDYQECKYILSNLVSGFDPGEGILPLASRLCPVILV